MRRHGHDRAGAVAHEHVVARPHRDEFAGGGVDRPHAGVHAGLAVGVGHPVHVGAVAGLGDVRGQRGGIAAGRRIGQHRGDQRVFGRHDHVRRAADGVGPRGEDLQRQARDPGRRIGEVEPQFRSLAAADPLALHGERGLGPVQSVEVLQQPLGVGGDAEHPLTQRLAEHREAAAFAAAVDDLLVGQGGPELRAPVDGLLAEVGQTVGVEHPAAAAGVEAGPSRRGLAAGVGGRRGPGPVVLIEHEPAGVEIPLEFGDRTRRVHPRVVPGLVALQPDPLGPPVVVGVDGRELAVPVVAEAEPLQLATERVDRLAGGDRGMDAGLDGVLLGRKPEGVPAHRMQDVEAPHPLVAAQDVGGRVALGMAHVEPRSRGVGEHVEAVELRPIGGEAGLPGIGRPEAGRLPPRVLPAGLDPCGQGGVVAVTRGRFGGVGGGGGGRGVGSAHRGASRGQGVTAPPRAVAVAAARGGGGRVRIRRPDGSGRGLRPGRPRRGDAPGRSGTS